MLEFATITLITFSLLIVLLQFLIDFVQIQFLHFLLMFLNKPNITDSGKYLSVKIFFKIYVIKACKVHIHIHIYNHIRNTCTSKHTQTIVSILIIQLVEIVSRLYVIKIVSEKKLRANYSHECQKFLIRFLKSVGIVSSEMT